MHHRPRKRFGQHFLQSPSVLHQLMVELNLQPQDHVVEIGPGLGALTRYLLQYVTHLTAIEIDRDLLAHLRTSLGENQVELIDADALTIDYSQLGNQLRITGNLPYNISTPLLFHLLNYSASLQDMHFMLQKEVVKRICSSPGTKDYGRLSVMIQYFCSVDYLFDVPPTAFDPPPKVDSAIVRLIPYREVPYKKVPLNDLKNTVAQAFSMRRKTMMNNFKGIISGEDLTQLGIDPTLRPETISVEQYATLASFLSTQ